ncbi:Transcriptional activator HAC1 [Nakaseomyces bracarensis]|uniref:Transcriptional activator HAC1 n=1 Tax=Nakaseomyces bracarensis TaxID=273131 RepID=A0ABR4NT22_9SACH
MSDAMKSKPVNAFKLERILNPGDDAPFETWMTPRKRAKTDKEREIRKIQKVLRNRRAARNSRVRKRKHVETLEKKCSIMRQIIDELQDKINVEFLLSDKDMWKFYRQLEWQTDLVTSTPTVFTVTSNKYTRSEPILALGRGKELDDCCTTGENNKSHIKASLVGGTQIGTKPENSISQSIFVRDIGQLTPLTSENATQSISPHINLSDCTTDGRSDSIIEYTPLTLFMSTSDKFANKANRVASVSRTPIQWFTPTESQSTHLNSDNQSCILTAFDSAETSENSMEISDQFNMDHYKEFSNGFH